MATREYIHALDARLLAQPEDITIPFGPPPLDYPQLWYDYREEVKVKFGLQH